MKLRQTTEKKRVGRRVRSSAEELLKYEGLWVETFRGMRDGKPATEGHTLAGGSMFIKSSGAGPQRLYIAKSGKSPRTVRQPKFDTTPAEILDWRSRVQNERARFQETVSDPVRVRFPPIPAERRLWEALKRANTVSHVRKICSQSKEWLKPRLELPDGGFFEYWPFRRVLYRDAEKFCRAKRDPRYPRRDERK